MRNLRLIVLKFLSRKEMSGYSLIKYISENTSWKPSTGSVYPLLISLHKDNLVNVREEGRRKVYSLTSKGKEKLELLLDKSKLLEKAIESLRILESISDNPDEVKKLQKILLEVDKLK
ncbi:PadR family transcriptional regulator [Nanoarchaeota archaeon]